MAFPDGTPEKTSRFTAVSALVMRKYSTKVLSAGMYFPCLDSMITSFLFCGFGGARSCGSRAERIHAGRSPTASLHAGGADGPQPIPLESKEKRGLPGGDVDAPWWSWRESNPRPRFRCRAKRQKGANQLSRPLSRFIYGRRALPPGTSPEFLPSGLRGSSQSTHHARRASISTDL